jgi:hypothetical protein
MMNKKYRRWYSPGEDEWKDRKQIPWERVDSLFLYVSVR